MAAEASGWRRSSAGGCTSRRTLTPSTAQNMGHRRGGARAATHEHGGGHGGGRVNGSAWRAVNLALSVRGDGAPDTSAKRPAERQTAVSIAFQTKGQALSTEGPIRAAQNRTQHSWPFPRNRRKRLPQSPSGQWPNILAAENGDAPITHRRSAHRRQRASRVAFSEWPLSQPRAP